MARWNSCNILHVAPDAKRLWQFDAKGGGFALNREQRVPHTETLPDKGVAKNWSSLWQPKLNIAWLPAEAVFLRVIELPASNVAETLSMVELQLEKLSPLPVAQIVWTMHILGTHTAPPKGDVPPENLQTVVVVIAERSVVEEFLGKLERDGYLADRLETPLLDQFEAVVATRSAAAVDAWLFPLSLGGQSAALVACWSGGVLRNLSFVTLPATGDRTKALQEQLAHVAWSGELEGWLTAAPHWHLAADPAQAAEWENALRASLNETVSVVAPPAPVELAARTAKRAAAAGKSSLLPEEFTTRYHQQFVDRLWLRGLLYAGVAYAIACVIYFCATSVLGYRTRGVETQVAALGGSYTNSLQLQAVYNVLRERSQLKYAALDAWQWVAQELPPGIALQQFSFANGQAVALSGTAPRDMINTLFDFNMAFKKKKVNDQFVFDQNKGDTVNPREVPPNNVSWNLSVELLRTEAEAQ
jgi:hypothetical protein